METESERKAPPGPGSWGTTRVALAGVGVALLLYSIVFYSGSRGFIPPDPVVSVDSAAVLAPMDNLLKIATEETIFQAYADIEVTADKPASPDGHYLLIAQADYRVRFGFEPAGSRSFSAGATAPWGENDALEIVMPHASILSIEMVTESFSLEGRDRDFWCSAQDVDNSFEERMPDVLDELRAGVESQAVLSAGIQRAENNFTTLAGLFYRSIGFEVVSVRFLDGGSR